MNKHDMVLVAIAALSLSSACSQPSSQAATAPKVAAIKPNEGGSPATSSQRQPAPSAASKQVDPHATMIAQMKAALVGHARLDGAVITGFRSEGACQAEFTTGPATTVISWREVGNVAGRLGGGGEQTALFTNGVTHQLFVPTDGSSDAEGVGGALGQLAEECGAVGDLTRK